MFLDLHCPHITGDVIYLVGSRRPVIAGEQERFSELLEETCRGPLPVRAQDFLPFGTGWNRAGTYAQGMSCAAWAAGIEGVALASTIEIPYADVQGAEVNAESAAAFGADLARTLARYLDAGC